MELEVTVRPATAADIPGVVECSAGLFAEDAGTRDPSVNAHWPLEHGAQRFAETVQDPLRVVLVAEIDGRIGGLLTGVIADVSPLMVVKVATLSSMYVRPEHRGRAAGTRLVQRFRVWAEQQGAAKVEVSAYASNVGALRFYERNGFAPLSVTLAAVL